MMPGINHMKRNIFNRGMELQKTQQSWNAPETWSITWGKKKEEKKNV